MRRLNQQKLREKIEKTGLTAFAFAKRYGFNTESLRRWVKGEREAKISNIQQLATALHCEIEDITDVVFAFDQTQVVQLEKDRDEICGLFARLNDQQRRAIIHMAQTIADANMKVEEAEV